MREVELKLKSTDDGIRKILSLLSCLKMNGNQGHSGYFRIAWDGDGSDFLEIEPKELYNYKDFYGIAEIHFVAEDEKKVVWKEIC